MASPSPLVRTKSTGVLLSTPRLSNTPPLRRAALFAAAAVTLSAIAFGVGSALVGTAYSDNGGTLNSRAVVGVALWGAGAAAGPALFLGALTFAGAAARAAPRAAAAGAGALTAAAIGGVAAGAAMVHADKTFFTAPQPDTLNQFLGGLLAAAAVPVALAGACVTAMLLRRVVVGGGGKAGAGAAGGSGGAAGDAGAAADDDGAAGCCGGGNGGGARGPRRHQPDSLAHNWRGLSYAALTLAGAFGAACTLTCIWNFSATSYFQYTSTYSWVQDVVWHLGPAPSAADAAAGWVAPILVPKVYSDVLVYFSVVGAWVIVGAAGTYNAAVRRALHRRFADPTGLPKWLSLFPHGVTRGEAALVLSFVALNAWWFWYWAAGYPRIMQEGEGYGDAYPALHGYARVMGHMTTLAMSFLTFPVVRNSVWESAFGVPFDRAVKYHRALGRWTWLLVTAHMLMWHAKWALEDTLWSNVVTVDNLQVTAQTAANGGQGGLHGDNFTIVLVETAWLLLTLALVVAVLFRRAHYEAFQYTHHFAALFMLAAIVHAWSHWYYTAAGLVLWAFDKAARTVRAARPARVLAASHADGVTRLTLAAAALGPGGHYAGQYAWLCVPAITPFQWHPFTISSSPAAAARDGAVTFHIKDMGPGTWTGRLAAGVLKMDEAGGEGAGAGRRRAARRAPPPPALELSLDGPYGRIGHYYEGTSLLLVAGGIGFTPFHALLEDLLLRATAGGAGGAAAFSGGDGPTSPLGALRHVRLLWIVRDERLPHAFARTLLALADASRPGGPLPGLFGVDIFLTGGGDAGAASPRAPTAAAAGVNSESSEALLSGTDAALAADGGRGRPTPADAGWCSPGDAAAVSAMYKTGRPDLAAHVADAAAAAAKRLPEGGDLAAAATVAVCGPAGLIDSASALALQHGVGFHHEVFHF